MLPAPAEKSEGGYIHHAMPTLSPDQVSERLAAENARRNPGAGFSLQLPSPSAEAAAQVQTPETPPQP